MVIKMHKISVIVPVYNTAEYLPKCIDSIINQTYKNTEIILVNDGSTDNSGQICDEYAKKDSRIVVVHQKNGGPNTARKKGIKKSTGDYIGFVDSDDWIDSDRYENMLNLALKTDADIVDSGWTCKIYGEEKYYKPKYEEEILLINDTNREHIIQEFLTSDWDENPKTTQALWSKLIKKELMMKVYNYLSNDLINGEDIVCILYLIQFANKIAYLNDYKYHYLIRENSLAREDSILNLIPRLIVLMREQYKFLDLFNYKEKDRRLSSYFVLDLLIQYYNKFKTSKNKKIGFIYKNESLLEGSKVILYGAGIFGKDYHERFNDKELGFDIICWVDKNYKNLTDYPIPIESPENIKNYDYDYVLVCIKDKNIFDEIKNELIALGIPEEKILYNERENTLAWLYK